MQSELARLGEVGSGGKQTHFDMQPIRVGMSGRGKLCQLTTVPSVREENQAPN